MIKYTIWRPDTCKCVIEYQYDDTLEMTPENITTKQVFNHGLCHSHISDLEELLDVIFIENIRKNKIINFLNQEYLGKEFSFIYDENRKLILYADLTEEEIQNLSNKTLPDGISSDEFELINENIL